MGSRVSDQRNKRPAMICAIFWQIVLLALCGTTLFQNLYFAGLEYTSATFASTMENLIPVVTFVMATTFRIEKVDIRSEYGQAKVLGTITCVGGAMIMTFYKGPVLIGLSGVRQNTWLLGALMLFASCLFWSGWLTFQMYLEAADVGASSAAGLQTNGMNRSLLQTIGNETPRPRKVQRLSN